MGFFSNLFKSEPSREEWTSISTSICEGLEGYIDIWYAVCVNALKEKGESIVNEEVTDEADLAIRSFQLMMTMNYIGSNQYISPENGADFADLLYANYCGTKLNKVADFGYRYIEVAEDSGVQISRFCGDVTDSILGTKSVTGLLTLTPYVMTLGLGGNALISSAFGDSTKANEMNAKYDQNIQKLRLRSGL